MTSHAAGEQHDPTPAWSDPEPVTRQSERVATTEQFVAPPLPPGDGGMAGTTTVANRVVAEIVGRAVHEVIGVHALVPRRTDLLRAWLRRPSSAATAASQVSRYASASRT